MCIVAVVVASVNSVSFALCNFASNEFKDLAAPQKHGRHLREIEQKS